MAGPQWFFVELKQLKQRTDRVWLQSQKPPEQMHTLFLSFIHKKVKRTGVTLVDEFFVCQLIALIHSHQGYVTLLVSISDPDQLGMEAGKLLHLADHNGSLQDSKQHLWETFSFSNDKLFSDISKHLKYSEVLQESDNSCCAPGPSVWQT